MFCHRPTADGRQVGQEVASAFRKIRKELVSAISEGDVERLGQMLPNSIRMPRASAADGLRTAKPSAGGSEVAASNSKRKRGPHAPN
jgi:hypothetical protein